LTEASNPSGPPAKPQDYSGLRDELRTLTTDYEPFIAKLWPRIEDNKYRWELHSFGLSDGCGKEVVDDIVESLNEALKSIAVAGNNLLSACVKADGHTSDGPTTS
jgi:hypothetical protein